MTENKIEFSFLAAAQTEAMISELCGLLAHRHPDLSLGELFEKLCDLGLQQWRPKTVTYMKLCGAGNLKSGLRFFRVYKII